MEILQFLISFFLKEYGGDKILPVFECLKQNSFDLKKTLQNLNPEILAPILQSFMEKRQNNNPRSENGGFGLEPINSVADKKIVGCLNGYFSV